MEDKTFKIYDSQKRAIKKYQEKHKEEIQRKNKEYSKKKYDDDPDYREYKKQQSKINYLKRKELKKSKNPETSDNQN